MPTHPRHHCWYRHQSLAQLATAFLAVQDATTLRAGPSLLRPLHR
ncbi:hypothetical protein [Streptomyces capitiformicae]|nr:hypothetical protein [Streptomyces capitiformicae]